MTPCKLLKTESSDEKAARAEAEAMARDLLSNSVIEDFRVEIER